MRLAVMMLLLLHHPLSSFCPTLPDPCTKGRPGGLQACGLIVFLADAAHIGASDCRSSFVRILDERTTCNCEAAERAKHVSEHVLA